MKPVKLKAFLWAVGDIIRFCNFIDWLSESWSEETCILLIVFVLGGNSILITQYNITVHFFPVINVWKICVLVSPSLPILFLFLNCEFSHTT